MSIVRRAAQQLAGFTVRYASPGSKPWAQAIAAELDCIENDWHALGWAFGSLRVLAHYRPAPIQDMQALTAAAEKHASRRRHLMNNTWLGRNLGWMSQVFTAAAYIPGALHRKDSVAISLFVAGQLSGAFIQWQRTREPNVPDSDDPGAIIRFYRDELARSIPLTACNLFSLSVILASLGYMVKAVPILLGIVALGGVAWVAIALNLYRTKQRQLAQVDALLNGY
ncbi:hypothetical protein [Silvibacterium sp.]|uniref:hypothetical protein n=1 Tax=Silvibacterium sp. TaxID=1964179 RepID=UPI0039E56F2A